MDVVLELFDRLLFDRVYATILPIHPSVSAFDPVSTIAASFKNAAFSNGSWDAAAKTASTEFARSTWQFQPASQYFSVSPALFGAGIYFLCATLSYYFVFDKTTFQHPKYLRNQIKMEIKQTLESIPWMALFTFPLFVAEVRGHSFIYDQISDVSHPLLSLFGAAYNVVQFPLFLMFTDGCIYWIHRGLHQPLVYKTLHKPHHKWIMPTPFASHAFHPIDGFAQSIPYHIFPLIFPLQKFAYIALFLFIQIWTVMIHDGEYVANSPVINGAACHTMHHLYFNYNYGQFTTLWDRLGGSYRKPNEELFKKDSKMSAAEWNRQAQEMEKMVVEVEGKDDRTYLPDKKAQ